MINKVWLWHLFWSAFDALFAYAVAAYTVYTHTYVTRVIEQSPVRTRQVAYVYVRHTIFLTCMFWGGVLMWLKAIQHGLAVWP